MTLSTRAQRAIKRAVTEPAAATELIAAIDAEGGAVDPAAAVAELGNTTNLTAASPTAWLPPGITGDYVDPNEPTGGEIDVVANNIMTFVDGVVNVKADNEDLETLRTETEARLGAIEAKIDELLGALKDAGLMAE
jgi:hypothetical protein